MVKRAVCREREDRLDAARNMENITVNWSTSTTSPGNTGFIIAGIDWSEATIPEREKIKQDFNIARSIDDVKLKNIPTIHGNINEIPDGLVVAYIVGPNWESIKDEGLIHKLKSIFQ